MRKLTLRERVLLVCLGIVAAVSAYLLLFAQPMERRQEQAQAQLEQAQELSDQMADRVAEQQRMERELVRLEKEGGGLPAMPVYDNLQGVLDTLHTTLASCQEYSLSFQGSSGEDHIYRRQVTMPFRCADYNQAKRVLQQLHDGPLRCLLENVDLAPQEGGGVTVTATVTFFEYQEEVPQTGQTGQEE